MTRRRDTKTRRAVRLSTDEVERATDTARQGARVVTQRQDERGDEDQEAAGRHASATARWTRLTWMDGESVVS